MRAWLQIIVLQTMKPFDRPLSLRDPQTRFFWHLNKAETGYSTNTRIKIVLLITPGMTLSIESKIEKTLNGATTNRRNLLRKIGAGTAGYSIASLNSGLVRAQNANLNGKWPQFGFDGRNSRFKKSAKVPVADITEEWSHNLGDRLVASPLVAQNRVIIGSSKGDDQRNLYSINARNGEREWSYESQNMIESNIAIKDGYVFVIGGSESNKISVNSGRGGWDYHVKIENNVRSAPSIKGKTIYFGDMGTPASVYAVDVESTNEKWTTSIGNKYKNSSPAIDNNSVYIGERELTRNANGRAMFYSLDRESGNRQWSFNTNGEEVRSALVQGEFAYTGIDGRRQQKGVVYALNRNNGNEIWRFERAGQSYIGAAVSPTSIVLAFRKSIHCLDPINGETKWVYRNGQNFAGAPVIAGATVFCTGDSLVALYLGDGSERWKYDIQSIGSPAVVDGYVFVSNPRIDSVHALSGSTENQSGPSEKEIETEQKQYKNTDNASTRSSPYNKNPRSIQTPSKYQAVTNGTPNNQTSNGGFIPIEWIVASVGSLSLLGGYAFYNSDRNFLGLPKRVDRFRDSTSEAMPDGSYKKSQIKTRTVVSGKLSNESNGPPESIPNSAPVSIDYSEINKSTSIGKGGNADVYRASVSNHDNLTIAIKEPRFENTLNTEVVEQFQHEAEIWERLDDHEHIVDVIDWDTEPLPWIAMEYMNRRDLSERSGELPFSQAVWTCGRIAEGVAHAHDQGVAHLDLKPANILLKDAGDGYWDVPKIGDWGIAKLLLHHSKSVDELSPEYAAPEQFDSENLGKPDHYTDIYQLGSIFYELLTGDPPFSGPTMNIIESKMRGDVVLPSEINETLPPAIDEVLLKAMAIQKEERYESISLFKYELQEIIGEFERG
jgi:outer membrane protein assembly factor BamB/tRNA A-37 threonylcarbamoyl transferase component Bud32